VRVHRALPASLDDDADDADVRLIAQHGVADGDISFTVQRAQRRRPIAERGGEIRTNGGVEFTNEQRCEHENGAGDARVAQFLSFRYRGDAHAPIERNETSTV